MKKLWTFFILVMLLFSFGNKVNAQTYCVTSFSNVSYEHITNVTFGSINNTTAGVTGGPVDFTTQSTTVNPGVSYPLSVTILADGSEYIYAFFDWNQNGILNDADEVYTVASNVGTAGPHTINVAVPATALPGSTRMRVVLHYNGTTPNPCVSSTYGEVEDYTVNVASSGAILPPTAFTATPFSVSQINLSWTQNANLNNVIILRNTTNTFTVPVDGTVYTVGSLLGTATVVYNGSGTSFSDASLSAQTTYYYKAYSVTGANAYSVGPASASATTPCATTPIPWNEGFEGLATVGTNILPNCWAYTNITGSNYSCSSTCNSNTAHSGTKFIGGSWGYDVWNYTPGFQLTAGTSYDFSYWFKCADNVVGYDVSLFYGNAQNVSAMTNSINAETGLNINTWTQRVFSFTPATTGVFYFGIHTYCTSAPNGFALDDFKLEPTPACPAPTALTATGITSNSAVLGWTSTAASFDVEFGTYGFTPTGTPTNAGVTNGFTKSGLSGYTRYSYYVRSICAGGALSPWNGPYSFYTLCAPVTTFPLTENFVGALVPPNACWSKYGGLLANPSVLTAGSGSWVIDDYLNVTSPVNKAAKINVYSTLNGWLVTPQIDLGSGATTYALKFNLGLTVYGGTGAAGTTGTDDRFAVVISTDGGTTWSSANVLRMWDNAGSSYVYNSIPPTGQSVEISLAGYTGLVKIGFYGESTVSNADNDLFVDDVVVYQPTNMSYVSSTSTQPSSAPVVVNTTNNIVLGAQIVTTGTLLPLNVSSFVFNTNGSTNAADILKAKLWTSGTNSSVNSAVIIDSVLNPSGSFTFTPAAPYILSEGTNYFWLTYDISPTATNLNIVDAEFTSATVGGTPQIPAVTAPAGNRTIKTALNGVYTIDNTLPTSGINYANFTDAVNDLNILGISGPVTFNVVSGQTHDISITGSLATTNYGLMITATGTAANPIVFQKYGALANPVINFTSTTALTSDKGIWINGGDYITFNGIDIKDAGTNLDWGFYLAGSASNGCQYNTIKNCNITLSNTSSNTNPTGIYVLSTATSATGKNNYNKFYNNTISKAFIGIKFTGASSYYDIRNEIGTELGGINTITNLGYVGSVTTQGIALAYQDSTQIFNTLIDTLKSTTTTAGSLCGIQVISAISNFNIYNNTIRQIVGYETYGINFAGAAAGINYFHHNVFTNISSSVSGNLNVFRDEGSALGTCHIYNNEIYNISSTFGTIEGFYLNSASTFFIYNNKIRNLSTTATAKQVEAIALMNASNNSTIYNNQIYDLKAAASSTSPSTVGIRLATTTTAKLYYNTIYLDYVSTNASNTSACVYAAATPTSLDMRNNIFVNKVDVTTGTRAAAFWWASTTYTNINAATNNNLYYAGVPSSKKLIFYNGVNNDSTLALFKTRLATKDQASKTEDVPFISGVFPYNLNIQTTVETQAESGGIVIPAYTTDFAGTSRYPNAGYPNNVIKPASAPDLGAYEFAGIAKDLTSPSISFTDLINVTNITGGRDLTNVSITDQGSVNTSTYKPRLYYKKSTHANTYADNTNTTDGWKYVETTGTVSPFSFTIDYSKLYSAPVAGDTLQYFVIAQDNEITPNVGAVAATFTSNPVNVNLTAANFPTTGTLKFYKFVNAVNGTILVGQGNPFNCLTCAGDTSVFKYINNNVVTGNVELVITSNLAETGITALNQFTEEGAGNYTITIKPQAANIDTIRGSYSGALIRLNGADRVIFDGRYDGDGNYLTFANTGTSGSVFLISSLGTGLGANNNTIRNCNMYMGGNGSGTYGISVGGTSNGSSGANNNNLSILNNNIAKVYVGIYAQGIATTGIMNNLTVSGNIIGHDSTSMYLGHDGILIANTDASNILGNKIFNVVNANTTSRGITLSTNTTNTTVANNIIDNFKYTGTGGYGSHGIYINTGTATSNLKIINNVVNRISGDGWNTFTGSSPAGILIDGITGGIDMYYNTVSLNDVTARTTQIFTGALVLNTATITNLNVKNNIFSNTFRSTGNMTSLNYAIYSASPMSAFTSINNNLYAINDTSIQGRVAGSGTTFGALNYLTLADWQAATLQDANSVSANAQFTSVTDLTPLLTSPALSAGTPIAGITTDITAKVRDLFTPTIGAYEVSALKTLNLTLFLEGLYNGTGMNEAADDLGSHWGAGIADQITVELRNSTTYAVEYTFTNQNLNTDGSCSLTIPGTANDAYYIAIKHRNSLQTWSSLPISFASSVVSYNFTTDVTMAYGDNMKAVAPGVYAFFVGDVNQDEVVDLSDLVDMDVDLTLGTVAYIVYDLNGDGVVDLSDLVAIDENLTNGVVAMYPF